MNLNMGPARQQAASKPKLKVSNWPKFQKQLIKKLESINTQDEVHNESEF